MNAEYRYGPQPICDNPVDGLHYCADILEALEHLFGTVEDLGLFERCKGNGSLDGLCWLVSSLSAGVRCSTEALAQERKQFSELKKQVNLARATAGAT
jgi:hypothetical protein